MGLHSLLDVLPLGMRSRGPNLASTSISTLQHAHPKELPMTMSMGNGSLLSAGEEKVVDGAAVPTAAPEQRDLSSFRASRFGIRFTLLPITLAVCVVRVSV